MACLAPDGKFCIFKKKNKHWHKGLVHPSYSLKGEKGPMFENYINHFMSKDISELLARFNRNSSLYALELKKTNNPFYKNLKIEYEVIFEKFHNLLFLTNSPSDLKNSFFNDNDAVHIKYTNINNSNEQFTFSKCYYELL